MRFGEFLKQERARQNISQGKLARMTGISHSSIHFYERCMKEPTVRKADALCRALGVTYTIGSDGH